MELIGKILNKRYEIIEKIGQGGMATVYKAKDTLLSRFVAVKVLKEEYLQDSEFVKRFRAEAQAAGSLSHPNIVSIYDVGEEDNINYIVMELIEGFTLKEYIEKHGYLPAMKALKVAIQIASALEVAHKAKIIHRDIKPHNIMLTKEFMVKVSDFGIAKISTASTITNLGNTVGSVHYFSPEHAKGGYTDEKSDIYSLGIVMYEMVTGVLPFDAESPVAIALKHIQETPVEPIKFKKDVPISVNGIIMKALEKSPSNRYQSAGEMIKDIYKAIKNPSEVIYDKEKEKEKIDLGATQVIKIPTETDEEDKKLDKAVETYQEQDKYKTQKTKVVPDIDREFFDDETIEEEYEELEKNRKEKTRAKRKEKEEEKEQEKELNKKPMIIAIVSVLVVALLGLGGAFVFFNKKGETIKVPDLVGKEFAVVEKEYRAKGIEIVATDAVYHAEILQGSIVSQAIDPGLTLKGKRIEVTVSKGPKMVKVPDLANKEYKVAKYELEQLELVAEFDFVINNEVAENLIIKQSPLKDEEVIAGSVIKIQVSKGNGKLKFPMPKLTDMSVESAKKIIEEKKLILTKVHYEQNNSKPNGYVTAQSIPQNKETEEGSVVEITVNRLSKTKEVVVSLAEILPKEKEPSEGEAKPSQDKSYNIRVTANVEGVTNTVYTGTHKLSDKEIRFTVSGFTTANIKVYVEKTAKKELTVDFTK